MKIEFGEDIDKLYGRDLLRLTNLQRKGAIKRALKYWRNQGFPYPSLTIKEIHQEFNRLKLPLNLEGQGTKTIGYSSVGLRLANNFHPQMWNLVSQGHSSSPIEHFNDDDTLEKLLERAIRFWPNRQCWSPYCLRNIFRVYAGGRVS